VRGEERPSKKWAHGAKRCCETQTATLQDLVRRGIQIEYNLANKQIQQIGFTFTRMNQLYINVSCQFVRVAFKVNTHRDGIGTRLDLIRQEAWLFCETKSGVRLWWGFDTSSNSEDGAAPESGRKTPRA